MMHVSPKALSVGAQHTGRGVTTRRDHQLRSRNPAARAWAKWTRSQTYTERQIPSGHLREWLEVTEVDHGRVVFDAHNVFQDGPEAVYTSVLYFRGVEEITSDLERAGFGDVHVCGGWRNKPVAQHLSTLVFQAKLVNTCVPSEKAVTYSAPFT